MNPFKIETFENNIDENVLLLGEVCFDSCEIKCQQQKGNFQTTVVKDSAEFHCDIHVTRNKVTQFSCDCSSSSSVCEHIVASLFSVRNKINETETSSTKANKKYTIDRVLETVSQEELNNFIKSYARKNQKFGLTLKANFARRIDVTDNDKKYADILDKIIKPITTKGSKYAASSIHKFLSVAEELFAQMKDAISLEQYEEAFFIHKNLIKKTAYAITNAKSPSDKLNKLYVKLHNQVDVFYQKDLAPELKQKLSHFILEILSYSYYIFPDFTNNLAAKIMQYAPKQDKLKLGDVLDKKYRYTHEKEDLEILIALKILWCDQFSHPMNDTVSMIEVENIKNIIDIFLIKKEYKLVSKLIQNARKDDRFKQFPFEDIEIIIAKHTDNQDLLKNAFYKKYFRTRSIVYLDKLLDILSADDKEIIQSLKKLMNARKMHQESLIDLAFIEKNMDEMSALIKEQQNLDYLEKYFSQLNEQGTEILDDLLHYFLNKSKESALYYQQHIERIKNIFNLEQNTQNGLWKSLFDLADQEHEIVQE